LMVTSAPNLPIAIYPWCPVLRALKLPNI
jgi:hypothetical protein